MHRLSAGAAISQRVRMRAVALADIRLVRRFAEHFTGRVPRILMFHRFAWHPAWRKTSHRSLCRLLDAVMNEYRVITLDEAVQRVMLKCVSPREVVLTVDDAYEDFHRIGLPEFEKRRLPATLFVPTDFVDRKAWLWPDRLLWLMRNATKDCVELGELGAYSLRTLPARRDAWHAIADALLNVNQADREQMLRQIEAELEMRAPDVPTAEYSAMTWDQVRDASRRGICIASQAGSHIPLSRESPAVQYAEAKRSKDRLESEIDRTIQHFSYPHGRLDDFNEESKRAAARAGYLSASAAIPEVGRVCPFSLPRLSAPDSVDRLRRVLSGISNIQSWSSL